MSLSGHDDFGSDQELLCPDCGLPISWGPMDDGWIVHCEPCGHYVSGPDLQEAYEVLCEILAEEEEVDEDDNDDFDEEPHGS